MESFLESKWSRTQLIPAIVSYIVVVGLSLLPEPLRQIMFAIIPGWLISYTPSVLITSLFIIDRNNMVHNAWDGKFSHRIIRRTYRKILVLTELVSLLIGWYVVINQTIVIVLEIHSFIVLILSGSLWGYIIGNHTKEGRTIRMNWQDLIG